MTENKSKKNEDKKKRLAKALRENLIRRKQKGSNLPQKKENEKPEIA